MEAITSAERGTATPAALDAKTACEAFQATAAAHPDRPAIRTKDDEFTCTWGEYSDRAKEIAAGLQALEVSRDDTVALMLTNRPEFHFADAGVMHLGATPFSIYNTYTVEQIQHLLEDSGSKVVITEQSFADTILAAREGSSVETIVVVDGEAPNGTISLGELVE